jgi:hypothetical protein
MGVEDKSPGGAKEIRSAAPPGLFNQVTVSCPTACAVGFTPPPLRGWTSERQVGKCQVGCCPIKPELNSLPAVICAFDRPGRPDAEWTDTVGSCLGILAGLPP